MGRLPQRTCIGCKSKKNKTELIRIVKNKNGEIKFDPSCKMDGRGTYICKNENCLNKAVKNKKFVKIFKTEFEESIYKEIEEYINGGEIV